LLAVVMRSLLRRDDKFAVTILQVYYTLKSIVSI
jgi:hypothetical protein